LKPDSASNYTVEFRTDSTVAVRLDCNRGRGTWVSRSASQLELGPLALTRAMCPHMALHDQLAKQWPSIRSYVLRDTHLFLSLMADGGTYEFEPANSVPAPSTTTPSTTTPSTTTPSTAAPSPPAPLATASSAAASSPEASKRASWLDESKPVSW